MLKKISIPVIILLAFASGIQSCKKRTAHDLSRNEEQLAVMLSKLPAFKENRKLFKKLAVEARKDTTKKPASKYTFEDYKSMKDNPYFTEKEKKDSLKRMGFGDNAKASIPPTRKKLYVEMRRNHQTINKELPEYAALTPLGRARIMKRALSLYRENSKSTSWN